METKPDTIIVFKNHKKKEGDKQPTLRGTAMCKCEHCQKYTEHTVNLWGRQTKTGAPYFSGILKPISEDEIAKKYRESQKEYEAKQLENDKLPDDEKANNLPF